jgi:N-acetylmuramoyl-L-alanine amidase
MTNFIDYDAWVSQEYDKPTVMFILDAGHGGRINGKYTTAPAKMYDHKDFVFEEGCFNRDIVKLLAKKFMKKNITHAFTTISNFDESLDVRGQKIERIVKAYPAYTHAVLSIHGNAATNTSANGVEIWTTKTLNDSDYLANIYYPHLYNFGFRFRINREKENEYDKEESWKMLRLAEKHGAMGLLLESGFFTNRQEALTMLSTDWQEKATDALLNGSLDVIDKIKRDGGIRTT